MNDRVECLLRELFVDPAVGDPAALCADWFRCATQSEVDELLEALAQGKSLDDMSAESGLGLLLSSMVRWQLELPQSEQGFDRVSLDNIAAIYRDMGRESAIRHHLLCLLAAAYEPLDLSELVELVVEDPPQNAALAAMPFVILLRRPDDRLRQLFPRLLLAMQHPTLASAVLDLANYVTREGIVETHPAQQRSGELVGLLGRLVYELETVEDGQAGHGQSPQEIRQRVSDGISLVVSLCDALGLIGDPVAIGKLRQVMQLKHRRLQVEAASALARLDVDEGTQRLIELASEPVVRLRVLAYAEEIELLEKIDEEYLTPAARAEAELASWLSQPTPMGFPPQECELIDQREQYWPGLEEPVWCFLFRYTYQLPTGVYHNVGMTGPLVHSFNADLTDLSPDDIYAAYAGWQVEHEDIYEIDVNQLTELHRVDVTRLERRLLDEGYYEIVPLRLGFFLGERTLVAKTERHGAGGIAVVDSQHVHWYPTGTTRRPLGADEAYCVYKGRKVLRTFNP